MSHVPHTLRTRVARRGAQRRHQMSHVSHRNESCRKSHMGMSHVTGAYGREWREDQEERENDTGPEEETCWREFSKVSTVVIVWST